MRDHKPIAIEDFNGLWKRGDPEACPLDHFTDCLNVQYLEQGVETRDGINVHQGTVGPLTNIVRAYNYITQDKNTLLVLDNRGDIWHIIDTLTVLGPILSKPLMTDFAMEAIAGRAYITPFTSYGTVPNRIEKGLQNEFLYVYMGNGVPARKAGGLGPIAGAFGVNNGGTGFTDEGVHLFAVVYETDSGFLSAPGPPTYIQHTTLPNNGVNFTGIPVSPDPAVTKRHIVASMVIQDYNGDQHGHQLFFIPSATINNNTATTLSNITFFDADLLEDASHLIDNFSEIPAGVGLTSYHGRLVIHTFYNDISLARVSAVGEPEVFNQVDGLIIAPLDGQPLTNAQEYRDVLYLFKRSKTLAYIDNTEEPSTWPLVVTDQAIGCPVHGIATVLDSGSENVDYLIVASFLGIVLFNGKYLLPELSYKIKDLWLSYDRNDFRNIQIVNDVIHSIIYLALPNKTLLLGDYSVGLEPKKIKWAPWRFDIQVSTVAIINTDTLIIGSERRLFS